MPSSSSMAKITRKTCVTLFKCDPWLSWPFATWPWPWPLISMSLISCGTFTIPLRVLWPSLGQDKLNAASPGPQNGKHYIFKFDFIIVSVRSWELLNTATPISLRPSVRKIAGAETTAAHSPLPPPRWWRYGNSPGGAGLIKFCFNIYFYNRKCANFRRFDILWTRWGH